MSLSMPRQPSYDELEQRVKELEQKAAENRLVEDALRESEALSRQIVDKSPIAMLIFSKVDNRVITVNKKFTELFGYRNSDVPDVESWWSLGYPDEHYRNEVRSTWRKNVEKAVEHGTGIEPVEARVTCKDGSIRFIRSHASSFGNKTIIASVDLTDLKYAEEALRKNEELFKAIFNNAGIGIGIANKEKNFSMVNKRMAQMFGTGEEEFLRVSNIDVTHPEDAELSRQRLESLFQGEIDYYRMEKRYIRKDKSVFWVDLSVAPIRDEDGNVIASIGMFTDITDRKEAEKENKRLQAQLGHAQRMESIGTLAGGIAHNFNNLLMGIQGNTSLMLFDVGLNHPFHPYLRNIERLVRNGSKLTAQLIGYAREGRYEVKPISLNRLVRDISDTFGTTRKEIRVYRELSENLYGIYADQSQIEQVLLNLFVNAADVMRGGGDLTLTTKNVTHEDMKDKIYKPKPGSYVLLIVKDTGTGIDKETMEHIFEPFFTTKGLENGTGLGLASVYGIVKGHGGYIDVESEKGRGTIFSIYLPGTEEVVREDREFSAEPVKGDGRVLLVDDEEIILTTGEQMLRALGYETLIATDGREALKLYEENQNEIDIVLLDMVMPSLGGAKTFDRLKEMNPSVKVLLSSGYSLDGEAKEIMQRGCDGFIQKPFDMGTLSHSIKEILERNGKMSGLI